MSTKRATERFCLLETCKSASCLSSIMIMCIKKLDFIDPNEVCVVDHYLKHACQVREKSVPRCLLNGIKPNKIQKFCLTSVLKCKVI